jgi:hypothetical protein
LPSNYKENNFDNLENTAPDVLYLRKLVKEKDLTIYVYQSNEETNIPDIDLSKKQAKVLKRYSVVEYFHKITSSREAVIDFIKTEMAGYNEHVNKAYNLAIAKNTTSSQYEVAASKLYSYPAFLGVISEFNLNTKDVAAIYKTGQPLPTAQEVFKEKTKSTEVVQDFLRQLTAEYPNMPLFKAYATWFANNTNANRDGDTLTPTEINWRSYADYCKHTFNYTPRDLTTLSKSTQAAFDRVPIKDLFKKATANKKSTLKYIKLFAFTYPSLLLVQAYNHYMGKYSTDTNAVAIQKDINYNYKAWLEKITNPDGPVKLTKEEVLKYFKDCVAEIQNNNK